MSLPRLTTREQLQGIGRDEDRLFFSANHEEIAAGYTTDIYFLNTQEVLSAGGYGESVVSAEVFARDQGVFAGINEVYSLLKSSGVELWAIDEGKTFSSREVVCRIKGKYSDFGIFETTLLGMLSSSSGWATAARDCKNAAGEKSLLCFGARHVHPAVAPVMERAALIGGADSSSCILAAKLMGLNPTGTMPHAAILVAGDTLELAKIYDSMLDSASPRIVLVDTFKDEAEETIRVARYLGEKLNGIRLDTPGERGGVTPALVREIRWRLDIEGFRNVKIFVSGGLSPDRIRLLGQAGADGFGVGSYIVHGTPRDMTMDIKEVNGVPVAKRGRLPGNIENPELKRLL